MNEENFLTLILANPEDTMTLLVYADWLEEKGDPRAEYLRLLHQVRTAPKRMKELRTQFDKKWLRKVSKGLKAEQEATGGRVFLVTLANNETLKIRAYKFHRWEDEVRFDTKAGDTIASFLPADVIRVYPAQDEE